VAGEKMSITVACAANAPVAAVALTHGSNGDGIIKVFDLDDGRLTAEILVNAEIGRVKSIDVSPSGKDAVVLHDRPSKNGAQMKYENMTFLDLMTGAVLRRQSVDIDGCQVSFVGDTHVAVASCDIGFAYKNTVINLFDLHSGAIVKRFRNSPDVSRAPISATSDGRLLISYTGSESLIKNTLQIEAARFAIWDVSTGRIVAQSPKLHVNRINTDALDFAPWSLKTSVRPTMQLNQAGNAVLVMQPGYNEPFDVYMIR
jgi:WD40 repeat protein